MSDNFLIEKAKISDIEELINIMFPKDNKIENAKKFRERAEPKIKENLSFVCKINNKIVGFTVLTKKENDEILIYTVFVDENHRRKGVATKLIQHSMNSARNIYKNAYFTLHVMVTKEKAINLYKKIGFKLTKTIPDFYLWIIPEGQERDKDKNYDGYEMEYHFD